MTQLFARLCAADLAYFAYVAWVRWKGLDFSPVSLDELGLSADIAVHHSASGGPDLAWILKQFQIMPADRLLDLGSGKGAACFTAAQFPFADVWGLEMSSALLQIAQKNAQILRLSDRVRFVQGNALDFTDYDCFTYLYLFNPFPPPIVQRVFEHVIASMRRTRRPLTILYRYYGPCPITVDPAVFPRQFTLPMRFGHPVYVFQHP